MASVPYTSTIDLVTAVTPAALVGATSKDFVGFYGTTPIAKIKDAGVTALASYTTGAFGLNSGANMAALHAMVVAHNTLLINLGLISVS